jgi:hypothetical protein
MPRAPEGSIRTGHRYTSAVRRPLPNSRISRPWRRLLAALLLLPPTAAPAQYGPVDPVDAASLQLARAVRPQFDGEHRVLLNALRQLKDPSLRPLFASLVQREEWTIQLDGILGLAELADEPVDPFLLEQIRDPRERVAAIRACLGLGMIDRDGCSAILLWPGLEPAEQVLLIAERMRQQGPPDLVRLQVLAENESPAVAGLAAMLLAQAGEARHLDRLPARLDRLAATTREATAIDLARAAERHRIAAAVPFLAAIASDPAAERALAVAAASALLSLDPDIGLETWQVLVERERTNAGRIRLATLLLATELPVPPSTFDAIEGHGEVLADLARAGRALSTGEGAADALRRIVDGGHRLSVTWAMTALLRLPPEEAAPIYERIVQDLIEGRAEPRTVPLSIEAAARLVDLDPDRLKPLLAAAAGGNPALVETLLVGLLSAESRENAALLANEILGRSSRRADSMATLCIARHAPTLPRPLLDRLGVAAGGGGGLDPALQAQAAWLYLKHTDQVESAMSSIFAGS